MAPLAGEALERVLLLDQLAANAWPAPVQQPVGAWVLRAGNGVTRRANSVLTAGPVPSGIDWLSICDAFYEQRSLPPRFQVSDATPAEVDLRLAALRYEIDGQTAVMIGSAGVVRNSAGRSSPTSLSLLPVLSPSWLDAYMGLSQLAEWKRPVYHAIFSSIGPRTAFAMRSSPSGDVEGVALGVTEHGWTGVFGVVVASTARRRGLATEMMGVLAEWSIESGAPNIYLQVMTDNVPAVELYRRLGFDMLYGYHYRTKSGENR